MRNLIFDKELGTSYWFKW